MATGFVDNATGGISLSIPQFGNTNAQVNSGFNFDLPLSTVAAFQNSALSFFQNNTAQSQGFLGGVINQVGGQVNSANQAAITYQNNALNLFGTMSGNATNIINTSLKDRLLTGITNVLGKFVGG